MNTLILSVSAGGGHFVTARALSETIMANDPDSNVHIMDAIKYISPVLDKVVIGTYLNSLRISPKAYDLFYSTFNKTEDPDMNSNPFIEKMEELTATKLLPLIEELEAEIILSTHPFATQLVASLKKNGHIQIPCLAVITDYGIHSATVHEGMDGFVVAHESLVPEMTRRGIPEELVMPFGIPVRASFNERFSREETLGSLNLDPSLPTVTMAGGSLGLGRMKLILEELDSIQRPFNVVVITSNNQKLHKEALEIAEASDKAIIPLKYCHFMDALLQSSDLLVTKPGGLTISEALITGVPMAIFTAVGGQEKQNRQFLVKNGLALDIGSGKGSAEKIEGLLFDEARRKAMAGRTHAFARPEAAQAVYDRMALLVEEHQSMSDRDWVQYPENLDASALDKLAGFTDDLLDDLAQVPVIGGVLEKVRGYHQKHDSEHYYELTDAEVEEILAAHEKKVMSNRPRKKLPGRLFLSSVRKKTENEDGS